MSRTDTALKPLVENSSSAAARIASRRLGLRAAPSWLKDLRTIFVLSYKRSGHVNENCGRWYWSAGNATGVARRQALESGGLGVQRAGQRRKRKGVCASCCV